MKNNYFRSKGINLLYPLPFFLLLASLTISCSKNLESSFHNPGDNDNHKAIYEKYFATDPVMLETLRKDSIYCLVLDKMNSEEYANYGNAIVKINLPIDTIEYDSVICANRKLLDDINRLKGWLNQKYKINVNAYILHEHKINKQNYGPNTKISIPDVNVKNPYALYNAICNETVLAKIHLSNQFHRNCFCRTKNLEIRIVPDMIEAYFFQQWGYEAGDIYRYVRRATDNFSTPVIQKPISNPSYDYCYKLEMIWQEVRTLRLQNFFYSGHKCYPNSCPECVQFSYLHGEIYVGFGSDFTSGGSSGGGSGGGSGDNPHGEICSDEKCSNPYCRGCISPSSRDCKECECPCTHEICKSCGLPIREENVVQTRSSAKCNKYHHMYCSSTGVVCDCGERHLNDEGIPKCATIKQEVYEKYAAYRLMWELNIAEGGCENGGFLLSDETVVINFNPNNKLKECTLGMSYSCPINTKYRFVYKNKDGIQYPVGETTALERTYIKGIVHPHPTPDSSQIISLDKKLGMLSNNLLISRKDIFTLKKYNVLGYILNQKKVYQFNAESYNEGGRYDNKSDSLKYFCPIVDTF